MDHIIRLIYLPVSGFILVSGVAYHLEFCFLFKLTHVDMIDN